MSSYISSIYCYCDHFCERCRFTARCAVFAGSAALADSDPDDPGFWQKLLEQFAQSHGLETGPDDWEIEVRKPTDEEIAFAEYEAALLEARLAQDQLICLSVGWQETVLCLLEDVSFWRAKARASASEAAMGLRSVQDAMGEAECVTDCLHRLRRFTETADMRLREAVINADGEGPDTTSGDGLAKSALHCLREARSALAGLFDIFPDEDRILPLFSPLAALERATDARFPAATSFVRPGFDEMPVVVTGDLELPWPSVSAPAAL
ncbi:MAG: hypothetical protein EOO08_13670 [Chitinophagaceae bacterium]|nr:MAG: hypothetical protein EOO08_13670 [Chitinophagaceae bacterium]